MEEIVNNSARQLVKDGYWQVPPEKRPRNWQSMSVREYEETQTQTTTKRATEVVIQDGLFFKHETVNHSAGEYKRGAAHTNSIESVWAVLKRGLHGVYHHASAKHLNRYVQEFAWRLNEGDVKRHTLERLASFVDAIVGKRLTYKQLIAEVSA